MPVSFGPAAVRGECGADMRLGSRAVPESSPIIVQIADAVLFAALAALRVRRVIG